jgi:hypothetical protein
MMTIPFSGPLLEEAQLLQMARKTIAAPATPSPHCAPPENAQWKLSIIKMAL